MDVFTTGIVVLFVMTAIFYIVLFSFIYYWHLKKLSFIVVPAFFTFDFLLVGFFVVAIVAIIINYAPGIVQVLGL
jgi:hypothetical protein